MKGSKMRTVNQVKTTNDYNMFKRCKGNRQINKLHVKRLKESMSEEFIPMPIIVNEKNEIIDGQHRFTAAKELGLDIPFIKVNKLGKNQIHRLNTNSKNWNGKDYLYDYCEMGMSDYIVYRDFIDGDFWSTFILNFCRYRIPIDVLVNLIKKFIFPAVFIHKRSHKTSLGVIDVLITFHLSNIRSNCLVCKRVKDK